MTDRELLELAAKAAGIVNYTFHDGVFQPKCLFVETGSRGGDQGYYWSPLTDDGDALRLAVRLEIRARYDRRLSIAWVESPFIEVRCDDAVLFDEYAATRRAIVRAAAEIGRKM